MTNTFESAGVSRRTGHPQVKVPGIRVTIDANMAPYIKTLKDAGLRTKHSCGGDEFPYIEGQTADKDVILVIRDILKRQGFVESYNSEEGGLVYDKYDNKNHIIASAYADYYKGVNDIREEFGFKTINEYEWSIYSNIGEKGIKTIIKPFVDAIKCSTIPKFKKGRVVPGYKVKPS